jgi:hypothetical protein
MRIITLSVSLLACGTSSSTVDGGVDAGGDGSISAEASFDGDACASCTSSLAALCASDASDSLPCPPQLGAPGFDAWARDRFSKQSAPLPPRCGSANDCASMTIITFNNGVDCNLEYVFDTSTKQLVAIASECNGRVGCTASDACLPLRCMSDGGLTTSASCPTLPDGGSLDASTD